MSRTKTGIDPELIRELATLLTETDLSEIEVQQADLRIRVARQINVTATVAAAVPAALPAGTTAALVAVPAAPAESDMAQHPGALKSPMVGTAYLGAAPGARPFVETGSRVAAGDRVMIVEAMKTFNDILAHKAGTVLAVLVDDKQPVEYGQTLLVIE